MLSSDELAEARAYHERAAMPSTCTIKRAAFEVDDTGGAIGTYEDEADVACRFTSEGGGERDQAGRLMPGDDAILTLPHGTAIGTNDQVDVDGTVYEVEAVDRPHSYQTAVTVKLVLSGV